MRRIRGPLEGLVGAVSDEQYGALQSYVRLVRATGARWNLMSRGALEKVEEHVVDSAAVLSVYDKMETVAADLGSGAGFPGVVLAILRPSWRVSLVDSRHSKAVFLREAVRELGLRNVVVVHKRIELLGDATYELVVSRALGSVEKTLGPSLALVAPGGRAILYKGPGWAAKRPIAEEIARGAGMRISREVDVPLPAQNRTTTFVVLEASA